MRSGKSSDAAQRRLVFLHASPLVRRLAGGVTEDIPTLDTTTEQTLLRETLAIANKRVHLRCQVATATNLRTAATIGCRVLHYTGHGLESSCLAFEDAKGAMHAMEPHALRNLMAAGGGATDIQLVFVSACYSQSAGEAFVRAGVPHVVACRWDSAVSDQASVIFSRNFYLALLCGRTVQQAFEIGHAAVRAAPDSSRSKSSEVKFMLLPAHADHNVPIFDDAEDGDWVDETPPSPPSSCDAVPRFFIGRNADVQRVVGFFAEKYRCVTVRGELGIGKTAVALRACEYMAARRRFANGIAFTRLGQGSATVVQYVNAMLGLPVNTSLEELLARIRDLHLLLVLDNVGSSVEVRKQVTEFLSALLRRTVSPAVLVTAEHAMGAELLTDAEKIVTIAPLRNLHAAALFTSLAPRKLYLTEMGAKSPATALQSFANHRLIVKLGGHPKAISTAAGLLRDVPRLEDLYSRIDSVLESVRAPPRIRRTLSYATTPTKAPPSRMELVAEQKSDQDLEQVLAGLDSQEISKLLADSFGNRVWRRVGGSKDIVSFPMLVTALENHLRERVPGPILRGFTKPDHQYIREMFKMLNGGADPLHTKVTLQQFANLWTWLGPVFHLIARVHAHWQCISPVVIHGFIGKDTAARLLLSRESGGVGTFIIRFSARHAGALAIAFLDEVAVQGPPGQQPRRALQVTHCLVHHIERKGKFKFCVFFEGAGEAYFRSLPDLLAGCEKLTHLYPRYPKAEIFSMQQRPAAKPAFAGAFSAAGASAVGSGAGAGAGAGAGSVPASAGAGYGGAAGSYPPPVTLDSRNRATSVGANPPSFPHSRATSDGSSVSAGSNQATSDESTAAVPHMRPLGGAGDPRAPAHLRSGVVNPEEDVAYLRSLSLDDRPTHAHPRAHHDHGGHAHAHAAAGRSGSSGRAMNGAQRGAHPAAHARAMAAVDPSDGPISNGL